MPAIDAVVHDIPMRWADLDSLNHVNNVRYVDYAEEARAALTDEIADALVRSMTVRYVRPLLLSGAPVRVISTMDDDALSQQICGGTDSATVAEVVTHLGERAPLVPQPGAAPAYASSVRRSDIATTGDVSVAKLFELFQEARILHMRSQASSFAPGRFVVGTAGVEIAAPVRWQAEPYELRVQLGRVGGGSFTVVSQLLDDDTVLAASHTVLVGFDLENQRSRRLDANERAEFEKLAAL